jgi:1,4-dihydroxy-2-naphthoate polyprenyltransferase
MITHWVLAARLKTLPVAICPILIGLTLTKHAITYNVSIATITLIAAVSIQIATNFANDYLDFKKGADTPDRVGPKRMTQSGNITPKQMKTATIGMFTLAAILGLYLASYGGWPIFIILIASLICGYIYTGGPLPLAYIGGAECVVFVFFGPISVLGTIYLQTLTYSPQWLALGCALGCIASALLVVNNTRDIATDTIANKKTWAVRFGRTASHIEYIIFIYTPIFLLDYSTKDTPIQIGCTLGLVVIALLLSKKFKHAQGQAFNKLLAFTSLYLILFTAITIYLLSA